MKWRFPPTFTAMMTDSRDIFEGAQTEAKEAPAKAMAFVKGSAMGFGEDLTK